MLQSNVQTIQNSVPSELVKQRVGTLVATFLSTLAGTPMHALEAALGPERKTLPQLRMMDFLWSGDGSYFPAFCSLCLVKTSYTYKINDLARSWIRAFPVKFLP